MNLSKKIPNCDFSILKPNIFFLQKYAYGILENLFQSMAHVEKGMDVDN